MDGELEHGYDEQSPVHCRDTDIWRRAPAQSIARLLVFALFVVGCSGQSGVEKGGGMPSSSKSAEGEEGASQGSADRKGLVFELRSSRESPSAGASSRTVTGDPLDEARSRELFSRLPELEVRASSEEPFRFASDAPTRTKEEDVESTAFPPSRSLDAPRGREARRDSLEVERHSPVGEVEVAPRLSVTFSRPMIAIGEEANFDEYRSPVQIRPELEGTWRWVGTRTLVFEPKAGRFSMASSYRATIPADVRSRAGTELGKPFSWEFDTPPLELVRFHPKEGRQPLQPLMFMGFNQRIDREKVIEYVRVWGGGETHDPKLAAGPRIDRDEGVAELVERWPDRHWLAFYVPDRLEPGTTYQVALQKGVPSAEGPRTSERGQHRRIRTRGAFELQGVECGSGRCVPGEPVHFVFNHDIEPDSLDSSKIRIEPRLENREVEVRGRTVVVRGAWVGETSYRVRVARGLRDRFGQLLRESAETRVEIGPGRPSVVGAGTHTVLGPESAPEYTVRSVNFEKLSVTVYRVEPTDWPEYLRVLEKDGGDVPGTEVFEKTIAVGGNPARWSETSIDLREALDGGGGHAVAVVRGVAPTAPREEKWGGEFPVVRTWVQSTDLAVDAFVEDREVIAWTTSLSSGEPVKGAEVTLGGAPETAETDESGVARLDLPESLDEPWSETGSQIRVEKDGETSFVPEYGWGEARRSGWKSRSSSPDARWFTFDDRGLYRPGETVHVKGWMRLVRDGELEVPATGKPISYAVRGPRGDALGAGELECGAHGAFDVSFEIPTDANLGRAEFEFRFQGQAEVVETRHSFQIEEFRKPSFGVELSTPSNPGIVGSSVEASAEATYWGGNPVREAAIAWSVEARPAEYEPPGWSQFHFGRWRAWWRPDPEGGTSVRTLEATTDSQGRHGLGIDLRDLRPPFPERLDLRASVTDLNRRTVATEGSKLVHPASTYVGLSTDRRFVDSGEPISVRAVATDTDGEVVSGREIRIWVERLEWTRRDGGWIETAGKVDECRKESGETPVECEFEPDDGGVRRIVARVEDEQGRPNESRMRVWVAGGDRPVTRHLEQGDVEMVPRSRSWSPGEAAEILVRAPFPGGEGLATVRGSGKTETIPFSFDGASYVLSVPVDESDIPNLHVRVDAVGAADEFDGEGGGTSDSPRRPAYASGAVELDVSTESRELDVTVEPEDRFVEPGSETNLELSVRTKAGDAVKAADVAVAVVDESVLAAADYRVPDPVAAFYPRTLPGVHIRLFRESVVLGSREAAGGASAGRESSGVPGAPESGEPPTELAEKRIAERPAIDVRRDIRPLAHFAPSIETDEKGRAEVNVELPDNVTRYRVVAVAAESGDRFGTGSNRFTAQLPVRLEPRMPRILRWKDRAKLPVLVHNQTERKRPIRVVARSRDLSFEKEKGVEVEVPANDRVEVQFPARATDTGRARVQFGLASGELADAREVEIPVRKPSATRTFAAHGTLSEGSTVRNIQLPDESRGAFGALRVTTSSTALQELTDALSYLVDYPYECTEQRASRVLAVGALRGVLDSFDVDGIPPAEELNERVADDLEALANLQAEFGGFPLWRRSGAADPYASVHAAHALVVGAERERDGSKPARRAALEYLRDIEKHAPSDWPPKSRNALRAYALYVLQKAGAPQPGEVARLAEKKVGEELSVEAAAWLMSTLAAMPSEGSAFEELRRQVDNRIVVESGSATVTTEYSRGEHEIMHSSRRADALVLEALVRGAEQHSVVPKLVDGLLASRKRGRWANTQENVFALLALERYFDAAEPEPPDFAADLWLGDGYLGRHEYRERTMQRRRVEVPLAIVRDKSEEGGARLRIDRSGDEGRLYYRIGLEYATGSGALEPVERGFSVERRYRPVGEDETVRRGSDGSWKVEAGARIRVDVEIVAPSDRHHVAVVDPLPAGFEPANPAVATTERVPVGGSGGSGRNSAPGSWFDHHHLRDERAEAFATALEAGVYSYSYVVRAATPGEYTAPAPRAEEMYHPETFGRGATAHVTVEPAEGTDD